MPFHTKNFWETIAVTGQWDYENKPEVREFLESSDLEKIISGISRAAIVVLGGDGTMLAAIDSYRDKDMPFLGINFGTVWYLMHSRSVLAHAQQFETTHHPLLKVQIDTGEKKSDHYTFGDTYMTPVRWGGICVYDVAVSQPDRPTIVARDIISSGVIVSTPAWSTGFSGNLGADILPLESDQFVMTHIAPPRARHLNPIQLPGSSETSITAKQLDRRPVLVYTDGRVIHTSGPDEQLHITVTKATKSVQLLIADSHRDAWYTRSLRDDGYSTL